MDQIIPGADKDIVTPLMKRIEKRYEKIYLKTKVTEGRGQRRTACIVSLRGRQARPPRDTFDKVLVAVGRRPNGKLIGAEQRRRRRRRARLHRRRQADAHQRRRTSSPSATSSASRCSPTRPCTRARSRPRSRPARRASSTPRVIPSVAYTDPEVAWVGLTENEAKAKGIKYGKGVFPWAASGRSLSLGRDEGMTKVLFDEATRPHHRLRHRRAQRRRPDRRGGARHRDGRRRRRHRPRPSTRTRRCRRPSAWPPKCSKARSPT